MRVDFLGSFKQVQRLINAKAQVAPKADEFNHIFEASKNEKPAQVAEIIEQNKTPALEIKIAETAQKARYDFSKPELLMPKPEALQAPKTQVDTANTTPISVKTPSGLTGRLLKIEDPFAGLDRLQRKEAVGQLVSLAGLEHGVDPALSLSVIKAESNFNATAVSNDGHASKGLMQLLDSTGKEMMGRLGMEDNYTPFDPEQNIDLGVGYLKRLHDLFSSSTELGGNLKTFPAANSSTLEKLAVAAYNAGEGRVASAQLRASKAGKNPSMYEDVEAYLPETTQQYVKKVISARSTMPSINKG